jgi:hypothetical protein
MASLRDADLMFGDNPSAERTIAPTVVRSLMARRRRSIRSASSIGTKTAMRRGTGGTGKSFLRERRGIAPSSNNHWGGERPQELQRRNRVLTLYAWIYPPRWFIASTQTSNLTSEQFRTLAQSA